MKLLFLGTGDSGTTRNLTSFLVITSDNQKILFDIGHGTVAELRKRGIDTYDIRAIVLSHFHLDHVGDLPFFLYRKAARDDQSELEIIAPTGLQQYLMDYDKLQTGTTCKSVLDMMHCFKSDTNEENKKHIKFIELDDNQTHKNNTLKIVAFHVAHSNNRPSNGYIVQIDGKIFGWSGDTQLCESLISNISNADTWLIDCSRLIAEDCRHMSLEEIRQLAKQYPQKNFYGIHRKDWIVNNIFLNIFLPNDGDIIEL